jgi:hypothetical protein
MVTVQEGKYALKTILQSHFPTTTAVPLRRSGSRKTVIYISETRHTQLHGHEWKHKKIIVSK